MKKIISIALILISFSCSAFSRIMFQGDLSGIGIVADYKRAGDESSIDIGRTEFGNIGIAVLWESKTDEEQKVHFFGGPSVGVSYSGLFMAVTSGANINLYKGDSVTTELCLTGNVGLFTEIFGYEGLYSKIDVDAIFIGNSRSGLYGGVGLSFICNPVLTNEDAGKMASGVALHIVAGLKI